MHTHRTLHLVHKRDMPRLYGCLQRPVCAAGAHIHELCCSRFCCSHSWVLSSCACRGSAARARTPARCRRSRGGPTSGLREERRDARS